MARSERPLDSGDSPELTFAAALRQLRQKAGRPTYRVLSQRTHYSVTTLSNAAAGRALPSLPVTLAYVRACEGDVRQWEQLWHDAAARLATDTVRAEDGPRSGNTVEAAPYPGLAAFQQEDGERFFGRDGLADELVGLVSRRRFVAVFGASGSGKSSLLRAGLLPRLRQVAQSATVLLLTPGPHPLEECAIKLAAPARTTAGRLHTDLTDDRANLHRIVRQIMAERPPTAEVILVVDQFEEIFTLCRSEEERVSFISSLVTAAQAPNSRCRVVLGVRADFYAHCTHYAELLTALADTQITLGPMSGEQLRQAIVQPAVRAGLTVEGSLVAALIAECHGKHGALPLLSHALLETWHRRRGNALTFAGYQAAGGMEGALARTAETFYAALTPSQQQFARQLFLRLTSLGEGTEDTRRRMPRDELDHGPDVVSVLEQAARARLLTLDGDYVDVTHEALIRCWPRLHQWLTEDRERLRRHRRLTEAARLWESLDRGSDVLYRGAQLAAAAEFTDDSARHDALSVRERAFLDASLSAEAARERRVSQRARRLRWLVGLLAVATLVATCAAGYALYAQHQITQQRNEILSRTVAIESRQLRDTQPALYAQLMMAAYKLSPTPEARDGLLSAASTPLSGSGGLVSAAAFDSAGRAVATGGDKSVQLWDVPDKGHPVRTGATKAAGQVTSVAFAPDGRTLAAGGFDHTVRLWDVSDRRHPTQVGTLAGHTDVVFAVAFSPDGRTLATASYDHTVRLWDLTTRPRPAFRAVLKGHRLNVKAVAFSHDGRALATGGDDRTVQLWDVTRPHKPLRLAVLTGHRNFVTSVVFSPDGRTLVSGSDDRTVRLWDTSRPRRPAPLSVLTGHNEVVISVALSKDGRLLASGGYDGVGRLWDVTNPRRPAPAGALGADGALNTVALSPDGRTLLTGGNDGSARLWPTDPQLAIDRVCARNPTAITRAQWDDYFADVRYRAPCGI
ncbi:XRE family transcriptional regulator [Streptomyces sp. NPDC058657]|uniref:nSTAND1 domain-containing NTPase n=1 Tax=unclassified Streptomyces TaxID=2593676 RepID=UPI0036592DAF